MNIGKKITSSFLALLLGMSFVMPVCAEIVPALRAHKYNTLIKAGVTTAQNTAISQIKKPVTSDSFGVRTQRVLRSFKNKVVEAAINAKHVLIGAHRVIVGLAGAALIAAGAWATHKMGVSADDQKKKHIKKDEGIDDTEIDSSDAVTEFEIDSSAGSVEGTPKSILRASQGDESPGKVKKTVSFPEDEDQLNEVRIISGKTSRPVKKSPPLRAENREDNENKLLPALGTTNQNPVDMQQAVRRLNQKLFIQGCELLKEEEGGEFKKESFVKGHMKWLQDMWIAERDKLSAGDPRIGTYNNHLRIVYGMMLKKVEQGSRSETIVQEELKAVQLLIKKSEQDKQRVAEQLPNQVDDEQEAGDTETGVVSIKLMAKQAAQEAIEYIEATQAKVSLCLNYCKANNFTVWQTVEKIKNIIQEVQDKKTTAPTPAVQKAYGNYAQSLQEVIDTLWKQHRDSVIGDRLKQLKDTLELQMGWIVDQPETSRLKLKDITVARRIEWVKDNVERPWQELAHGDQEKVIYGQYVESIYLQLQKRAQQTLDREQGLPAEDKRQCTDNINLLKKEIARFSDLREQAKKLGTGKQQSGSDNKQASGGKNGQSFALSNQGGDDRQSSGDNNAADQDRAGEDIVLDLLLRGNSNAGEDGDDKENDQERKEREEYHAPVFGKPVPAKHFLKEALGVTGAELKTLLGWDSTLGIAQDIPTDSQENYDAWQKKFIEKHAQKYPKLARLFEGDYKIESVGTKLDRIYAAHDAGTLKPVGTPRFNIIVHDDTNPDASNIAVSQTIRRGVHQVASTELAGIEGGMHDPKKDIEDVLRSPVQGEFSAATACIGAVRRQLVEPSIRMLEYKKKGKQMPKVDGHYARHNVLDEFKKMVRSDHDTADYRCVDIITHAGITATGKMPDVKPGRNNSEVDLYPITENAPRITQVFGAAYKLSDYLFYQYNDSNNGIKKGQPKPREEAVVPLNIQNDAREALKGMYLGAIAAAYEQKLPLYLTFLGGGSYRNPVGFLQDVFEDPEVESLIRMTGVEVHVVVYPERPRLQPVRDANTDKALVQALYNLAARINNGESDIEQNERIRCCDAIDAAYTSMQGARINITSKQELAREKQEKEQRRKKNEALRKQWELPPLSSLPVNADDEIDV